MKNKSGLSGKRNCGWLVWPTGCVFIPTGHAGHIPYTLKSAPRKNGFSMSKSGIGGFTPGMVGWKNKSRSTFRFTLRACGMPPRCPCALRHGLVEFYTAAALLCAGAAVMTHKKLKSVDVLQQKFIADHKPTFPAHYGPEACCGCFLDAPRAESRWLQQFPVGGVITEIALCLVIRVHVLCAYAYKYAHAPRPAVAVENE